MSGVKGASGGAGERLQSHITTSSRMLSSALLHDTGFIALLLMNPNEKAGGQWRNDGGERKGAEPQTQRPYLSFGGLSQSQCEPLLI